MLIFIKPRIVLLSVPKTGTTALEEALAPKAEIVLRTRPEIKHLNLKQYRARIRPLLAPLGNPEFQTVAVIREPLEWLRSWYRFRARDPLIGHPPSTAPTSFVRSPADHLLEMANRPAYARLGRQSDLLTDQQGNIAVDYIFRYEAMPALTEFLSRRLETPIRLPRRNVSPTAVTELEPETERSEEHTSELQSRENLVCR